MKKKLLIVTTVPITLNSILRHQPKFLKSFFEVAIATSPVYGFEKIEIEEDSPVYEVPMQRGISIFKDIYSLLLMIFLLIRLKPDIVHSYTPKAGLIAMLAARICFVPIRIHTFTGLIFPTQKGLKKKILIFIDRIICICASKIVPEGAGVKKDLIKYAITSKPLNVIGFGNVAGVDTNFFSPLATEINAQKQKLNEKLSFSENSFVFCFIGRLNKDKGIIELEQAFRNLPPHASLIIAGDLDSNAPLSSELYERLKEDPRVYLLGFVEDIRAVLGVSDILILPSYREGFPNVVLQAGAMEVPVIATNINGSNEIITDNLNGWLVEPKNADELKEAMIKAMNTPSEVLNKMGDDARALIQSRFERERYWGRLKEFYFNELNT